MHDETPLSQTFNDGVEAAAVHFDELAAAAEKRIEIALPGFHVQEAHGRVLALKLHATSIRRLKKSP